MAGAIDNNCLTNEYATTAAKIDQISVLPSTSDSVLEAAYPVGNPLQGIIDQGHPYYHAALGRLGPAQPALVGSRLHSGWQIPKDFDYGHLDYMPGQALPAAFRQRCEIPPDHPVPPQMTPGAIAKDKKLSKPAFSAGFSSCRDKLLLRNDAGVCYERLRAQRNNGSKKQ